MIREILKMGDERLLRVAKPVPAHMFDTPELWQLIDDMLQTMEHAGGVGLAAPQIGVDLQMVIFGFEHSERYPDAEPVPQTILLNPLITPRTLLADAIYLNRRHSRGICRLPILGANLPRSSSNSHCSPSRQKAHAY